jgi:hypothetical protein
MEKQQRVLIPVVGSDPTKNQLIEVYTTPYVFETDPVTEQRAIDKDWDRVVVHLRQAKLYHAGCIAVGAVRKLGLPKPKLAIYQWFKPQAWLERQRVHVYPEDIPIEGHSAELGLALLLLTSASHSTVHHLIIATGALSRQIIQAQDVKVLPVSQLAEKCERVIHYVRQNPSQKILFFTPCYDETDNAVEKMPEIQALHNLGITVLPIARLSEAVKALEIKHTGYLTHDRILRNLIAVFVITFFIIGLYWILWCQRAIEVNYVSGNATMTRREPFLVCSTQGEYYYQTIRTHTITSMVPTGGNLGWKIKVGSAHSFDAWLSHWFHYQGYYVANILIPQFSEPQVILQDNNRVQPGEILSGSWDLSDKIELKTLIFIAQRCPFNPVKIQNTIQKFRKKEAFSDETKTNMTAATNFILSQFRNGLKFIFQTSNKSECTL